MHGQAHLSRINSSGNDTKSISSEIYKTRKEEKWLNSRNLRKNRYLRQEITPRLSFSSTMHDSRRHHGCTLLALECSLLLSLRQHEVNKRRLGRDTVLLVTVGIPVFILLHQKFLVFGWLRAVVSLFNLKYLHVKITNLVCVVV